MFELLDLRSELAHLIVLAGSKAVLQSLQPGRFAFFIDLRFANVFGFFELVADTAWKPTPVTGEKKRTIRPPTAGQNWRDAKAAPVKRITRRLSPLDRLFEELCQSCSAAYAPGGGLCSMSHEYRHTNIFYSIIAYYRTVKVGNMSSNNTKHVQTELPQEEYDRFREFAREHGLSIREAGREALVEWIERQGKADPYDRAFTVLDDLDSNLPVSAESDARLEPDLAEEWHGGDDAAFRLADDPFSHH